MKRYSQFLRLTLTGALLTGTLLQAAFSYADDTEIFFGGALAEEGIRPNVLFILDDSGSMGDRPPGKRSGDTRLQIMKESFRQIVNNTTGVNIGVMRLNSNPRLAADVDYIDRVLGNSEIIDYDRSIRIASATDDASQTLSTANNTLNEQSLTIGGSTEQIVGLRFQDIPIPRNATITEARLVFTPSASHSDPITLKVLPEVAGDAPEFSTSGRLSNRAVQQQTAVGTDYPLWTPNAWTEDETIPEEEGADVSAQLQSIVNSSNWCGNNAAAFQIHTESGNGIREFHSYDSDSGSAPQLLIKWQASAITGCLNPIVEYQVSNDDADGIQIQSGRNGKNRSPRLGDDLLEFDTGRHLAARFTGVRIPRSTTILDAKLITTSQSGANNSTTAEVSIEDDTSPDAFNSRDNNISGRDRISDQTCTFSRAPEKNLTNRCSITNQIQTLVNKNGWSNSSRAIVAILRPNGDDISLIAHDLDPSQAMKLRIKYEGETPITYRENLISSVDSIKANGWTPIVPTMYDAAVYLRDQSKSPITSACQPTHIVLLSDGEANNNSRKSISDLGSSASSCQSSDGGERCGRDIAKYLAEHDQASWIEGANNYVTTHTIGFALGASDFNQTTCAFTGNSNSAKKAAKFLCEVAKNGGGEYYSADDANELTNAFSEIIRSVISTDASFVSASAPVNSFNRLDNRDELYFAVFRPQETDSWPGNLKRYRVDVDGVRILDANGSLAVDEATGFFSTTARSFWSTETDGNQTSLGGAASKLPTPRNLYTFTGNNPSNATLTQVTATTNLNTLLGAANDTERQMLINYLLGWQNGIADGTPRKAMGDPLHSSPRLVTYKENDSSIVIGTNEGMIHVINTETGVEQLAFIPKALLPNVKELMDNGPSSVDNRRPYGMDNTVTIWANDVNGNGRILDASGNPEAGEFVYAYATMGRGGRNLYALDLTNRSSPKLLWEIIGGEGGTSGFEKLGQTWSTPVRTKIKVGTDLTDVLIFAGGYDPGQDNQAEGDTAYTRREDTMGNALYIVNAKTGQRITSVDGSTLSKMKYSMPSPVRVIDLQQNAAGQLIYDSTGAADQIFVGDMGGQVWRFYINNGQTGDALLTPANGHGVIADLGGNGINARRFYHAPDVALVNSDGVPKLAINIGSGYRGHPLHTVIQDRFYSLQTSALTTTENEGLITEVSLADLTDVVDDEAADAAIATTSGWMIKLGNSGQKVLSAALTVDNVIYFNTYEPTAIADSCQANVGLNRAYSVSLRNATPVKSVGETPSTSDRFSNVSTSGLLPDPVVVTIGGKKVLIRFPSIEPLADEPEPSNYWIDITETD